MKKVLLIAVFLITSSLAGCKTAESTTKIIVEARKMPTEQYDYNVPLHVSIPSAPEFTARVEMEIHAIR